MKSLMHLSSAMQLLQIWVIAIVGGSHFFDIAVTGPPATMG